MYIIYIYGEFSNDCAVAEMVALSHSSEPLAFTRGERERELCGR